MFSMMIGYNIWLSCGASEFVGVKQKKRKKKLGNLGKKHHAGKENGNVTPRGRKKREDLTGKINKLSDIQSFIILFS